MFTNYAIANKTSIMYKYKFSVGASGICRDISLSSGVVVYYFNTNYPIEEIGVYYYTTNQANKTILPMSKVTFNNSYISVNTYSDTDGDITYKSRIVSTAPIFVLIKGLTESTTYHVGAYYKIGTVLINYKDKLTYLKISDNIWEPVDTMTTTVSEPEITSGYNYNRMDLVETRCSACGAPIKIRSRYETIVKCEYCEMTYRFEPKKDY